jgi:hypothetical protein
MTAPMALSQALSARADVSFRESDLGELATFIAVQSGRTRESLEPHLRWFLLENPARQPEEPLGLGLRSDGQIVGCILCVPQAFRFGNEKILLTGSSSFYVDAEHRGQGGRIFLKYSRLAKQRPLFGTSANASAAALWKAAGASSIPNSDCELFGVLRWPPLAEEFIHRRYGRRLWSRAAGSSISSFIGLFRKLSIDDADADLLHPITSAERVADLPVNDPTQKLTAVRDLPYIRWRYFSGRDNTVSAFTFRSGHPDREVLVTVNQRIRGYRSQIKVLNVLDVYPEVSPQDWLRIVGALIERYQKEVDGIVLRSLDAAQRKIFQDRGFHRRAFDAPTSWFLDKGNLLPSRDWYAVPADGDGLI